MAHTQKLKIIAALKLILSKNYKNFNPPSPIINPKNSQTSLSHYTKKIFFKKEI
jgi:hypothetical protein